MAAITRFEAESFDAKALHAFVLPFDAPRFDRESMRPRGGSRRCRAIRSRMSASLPPARPVPSARRR
jgi:hypothetical protein